jgi:hypothetical protein
VVYRSHELELNGLCADLAVAVLSRAGNPDLYSCLDAVYPGIAKGPDGDDLANAGLARERGQAEIWRLWLLHADEYGSQDEKLYCEASGDYYPARM